MNEGEEFGAKTQSTAKTHSISVGVEVLADSQTNAGVELRRKRRNLIDRFVEGNALDPPHRQEHVS